jgi:hypothetical protein
MGRDCVDGRERQRNKLLKEKKNKPGVIKIKLLKTTTMNVLLRV